MEKHLVRGWAWPGAPGEGEPVEVVVTVVYETSDNTCLGLLADHVVSYSELTSAGTVRIGPGADELSETTSLEDEPTHVDFENYKNELRSLVTRATKLTLRITAKRSSFIEDGASRSFINSIDTGSPVELFSILLGNVNAEIDKNTVDYLANALQVVKLCRTYLDKISSHQAYGFDDSRFVFFQVVDSKLSVVESLLIREIDVSKLIGDAGTSSSNNFYFTADKEIRKKDVIAWATMPIINWHLRFSNGSTKVKFIKACGRLLNVEISDQPDANIIEAIENGTYHDIIDGVNGFLASYSSAFDKKEAGKRFKRNRLKY